MPVQSAIASTIRRKHRIGSRIRVAIVLAALSVSSPAFSQSGERVELGLDQARAVAIQALNNGDPGLAIQLAKGLLKANPKDAQAYFILASGYSQLRDPDLARRAAGYAYRYSPAGPDRFQAAQLAAKMAFDGERYSLSQLWLRRTAIHAPSEKAEQAVARDYKLLRRINPWSLSLRGDIRPSDNVNNGSDTSRNIIDGVPDGGVINPSDRALSGFLASVDFAPSYRLRFSENSTTRVAARLYVERVSLSSEAKRLAPEATGSDYGSTYGELSLAHTFAVGPRDRAGTATVELAYGDSWYGKERNYSFARLEGERSWSLTGADRFTIRASAETRFNARYQTNDGHVLGIGAQYGRLLANGNRLNLSLALRDTEATSMNGTYATASMRASYTLGRAIGPARLSMGLVLGYSNYDKYRASLSIPATERTDKSVYGDLTLIFDRYDYAGFVPTLRLRTGRKDSNFSRFSSREFSISLGVGSKF